jgi:outer membrane protein assembly factor BamB
VLAGARSCSVREVPRKRLEKVSSQESGVLDEKGSDVGAVRPHGSADWPTYRGNSGRSGLTTQKVCADLSPGWEVDLDAKLTPPTVANGSVFVACPDRHQVVAISSESGEIAWRFTAGGPVDSPPTIHSGLVLFGCNDGYVYCLNASDGALAWRFHAARDTRRLVAYGRLESVSPVHGSVLVQDGAVYFVAGRLSYLDGGMDIYRLHPRSGKVLSKNTIYSVDPKTGQQAKTLEANKIPGSRSDILSADNRYVYLQDKSLDKETLEETRPRFHLFAMTGFLDDSWTHRSYWLFGAEPRVAVGSGGGGLRRVIYGRLLSYDQATVYGYARARVDWSNEFKDGPYHFFAQVRNLGEPQWKWRKRATIKARAMIVAGEIMFAGGQSANQDAVLHAISAVDGSDVSQHKLDADPVFNGMAAANGKLFISLVNGKVICMQGK